MLNMLASCEIKPEAFTDHSSVCLNFVALNTEEKKKSYWKFNNDLLLEPEYEDKIYYFGMSEKLL